MDFNNIINHCRTIHKYDPQGSVDNEIIQEALELSLMAPNHCLTFPWKYLWVGPETRQKLALLNVDLKLKKAKTQAGSAEGEAIKLKLLKKYMSASHLIIFCSNIADDEIITKENYATLACSIQLFALSLARHRVGYKWSTSSIMYAKETYELLELDKDKSEIVGFIWAGKSLKSPGLRHRPPLTDLLRKLS